MPVASVILSTGNLLKKHISAENKLFASIQQDQNKYLSTHKHIASNTIQIGDWSPFKYKQNADLVTTAELFIPGDVIDANFLKQSCEYIRKCLGDTFISKLIINWTPLSLSCEVDIQQLNSFLTLWKEVEKAYHEKRIATIGVYCTCPEVIKELWQLVEVKPQLLFVDMGSKHKIPMLEELSQQYGFDIFTAYSSSLENFTSVDPILSKDITSFMGGKSITPNWIVRLSILADKRAVALHSGYIVSANVL